MKHLLPLVLTALIGASPVGKFQKMFESNYIGCPNKTFLTEPGDGGMLICIPAPIAWPDGGWCANGTFATAPGDGGSLVCVAGGGGGGGSAVPNFEIAYGTGTGITGNSNAVIAGDQRMELGGAVDDGTTLFQIKPTSANDAQHVFDSSGNLIYALDGYGSSIIYGQGDSFWNRDPEVFAYNLLVFPTPDAGNKLSRFSEIFASGDIANSSYFYEGLNTQTAARVMTSGWKGALIQSGGRGTQPALPLYVAAAVPTGPGSPAELAPEDTTLLLPPNSHSLVVGVFPDAGGWDGTSALNVNGGPVSFYQAGGTCSLNSAGQWTGACAGAGSRRMVAGGTSLLTAVSVNQEIGARTAIPSPGAVVGLCCQIEVAGTAAGSFTASVLDVTGNTTAVGQSQACTNAAGTRFCYWVADGGMTTLPTLAGDLFVPDISATTCSVTDPELSCQAMADY